MTSDLSINFDESETFDFLHRRMETEHDQYVSRDFSVHADEAALARLRDYQADIDRASALLFRERPDMIAGDNIAIKETDAPHAGWSFVLALGASLIFWIGIGWTVARIV